MIGTIDAAQFRLGDDDQVVSWSDVSSVTTLAWPGRAKIDTATEPITRFQADVVLSARSRE